MAPAESAGAPALTLRTWLFGAPSRRALLEIVVTIGPPKSGWTKAGLERACNVGVGTLDDHLAALVGLDLLEFRDGRFYAPRPATALVRGLRGVLRETTTKPDTPAKPLRKRGYTPRRRAAKGTSSASS